MLKRFTIAGVSALVLAACADIPTDTAMQDVDLMMAAAPAAKVAVCHVGNELDDAGMIDLIMVPAKIADKHLNNPSHSQDGVSDYEPVPAGASGVGSDDTDGDGIDDGCEIPEPDPVPACFQDAISQYEAGEAVPFNPDALGPWQSVPNPFAMTIQNSTEPQISLLSGSDTIGSWCSIVIVDLINQVQTRYVATGYPIADSPANDAYLLGLLPPQP